MASFVFNQASTNLKNGLTNSPLLVGPAPVGHVIRYSGTPGFSSPTIYVPFLPAGEHGKTQPWTVEHRTRPEQTPGLLRVFDSDNCCAHVLDLHDLPLDSLTPADPAYALMRWLGASVLDRLELREHGHYVRQWEQSSDRSSKPPVGRKRVPQARRHQKLQKKHPQQERLKATARP